MNKHEKILNAISRFLHYTTEPFDDWYWDGKTLEIILNNKTIECYTYEDLKPILAKYM